MRVVVLAVIACAACSSARRSDDRCPAGSGLISVLVLPPCDPRIERGESIEIIAGSARTTADRLGAASLCVPAGETEVVALASTAFARASVSVANGGEHELSLVLDPFDDFRLIGDCTAKFQVSRYGASGTRVGDRVLMAGGANLKDGTLVYTRAIELFDPASERFDLVGELRSGGARAFHTATALDDGRVLITGGEALVALARESLKSALIVDARDPSNVTVTEPGGMTQARTMHTATRLPDGRVLIAGGRIINSASPDPAAQTYLDTLEIYDPSAGSFSFAGTMSAPRESHSATLLPSGDVLIAGGMNAGGPVDSLEVITISSTASAIVARADHALGVGPVRHTATLLADGRVMLTGGFRGEATNTSTAVEGWSYDPAIRTLARACTDALDTARAGHTADPLPSGRALIAGGFGPNGSPAASAELVTWSAAGSADCFAARPLPRTMATPRADHLSAILGEDGRILVAGGRTPDSTPFGASTASAELFVPRPEMF